jgi:Glutamyl-tRNA reductase
MKVVMVGSGNVATVLSTLIQKKGHEIVQVVSRNVHHAQSLASKFNVNGIALTESQFAPADIYIIALNDAALDSIEKIKALKNKFIVHTAGSVSKDVLKNLSSGYGVLYPLQTLSG